MPRNLVLCLDGTSDRFSNTNTNVVNLYTMLARVPDQQLSYYQPGIGTMAPAAFWGRVRKWFVKQIDLAIAWFLSEHVTDVYRFLMRYYQDGDRIYIFGFSRGAYTARALAGMLHKVGLLTQGNDALIEFAWDQFKNQDDEGLAAKFRDTFSRPVRVHFLGLWDTVSSIGWAWDPKHLPYTANNKSVDRVRHLVALDERRAYFVQNLWGIEPADVEQLWFPGVHGDVGGGYPVDRAGLSALALQWMTDKAIEAGLLIDPAMRAIVLPQQSSPDYAAPNVAGPPNYSLTGWWWIPEFIPKPYRDPRANFEKRWMIHAGRPRYVAKDARIHPAVYERMKLVPGYDPPNLPGPPPPTP